VITAVVPVSPIKSHPDTAVLDETLDSIRHHLPDAEIIVTFDGVREQQEGRRADYEEFIRRALWRLDKHYGNTFPVIFTEHTHQVGMLRAVLDEIRTPLLMYVEQDTPLVVDEPVDWEAITHFLISGRSNAVRLHHEAVIPDAHKHMIHGTERLDGPAWKGRRTSFLQTSQWSQRPHVASVAYYRRILTNHFSSSAKSFIEDMMHGVVDEAYNVDGLTGWMQHRVHIYNPDGENMKRSYHTDGRAGEQKFASSQVF
jgi:hypothetical protein